MLMTYVEFPELLQTRIPEIIQLNCHMVINYWFIVGSKIVNVGWHISRRRLQVADQLRQPGHAALVKICCASLHPGKIPLIRSGSN